VDIVRNTIESTQAEFFGGGAIFVVRQVEGLVHIADNFISPDPVEPGTGAGIYIFANDRWNDTRTSTPRFQIVSNRIVTKANGIGLIAQGGAIDGPVIARNHVSLRGFLPWEEGMYSGGNVSNAQVSSNRIDGAGALAFDVFAFEPGQVAESNVFVGNNLTQFTAGIADLFLDAHSANNVVVGNAGTVLDLGTGNQITGVSKIGHDQNIGRRIRKLPDFDQP